MKKTQNLCHDCKAKIKISRNKEIQNGLLLKYNDGRKDYFIYKCKDCYEKNKALTNFRKTEVYSRVVGYIRPVQQWNKGKQLEYQQRKTYNPL